MNLLHILAGMPIGILAAIEIVRAHHRMPLLGLTHHAHQQRGEGERGNFDQRHFGSFTHNPEQDHG